jgi:hypothetical protein
MSQLPDQDTDYDRGFRHGTDGIMFYPANAKDPAAYKMGYIAGRRHWKGQFGSYPRSGDGRWDAR